MTNIGLFYRYSKYIIALTILIISIALRDQLFHAFRRYFSNSSNINPDEQVLTPEELSQFNGIVKKQLYLAILGSVFDVTPGSRHYQSGGPYNYFVGKDGSRAFITGDFKDENVNKDHVIDLSCDELFVLKNWRKTLNEKYQFIGVVVGRFYDENGDNTNYNLQLNERLSLCEVEKIKSKEEEKRYPSCNIAWSADEGTRVWCTTSSGGVKRSWVGYPRQLFTPGEERPRCVCVNLQNQLSNPLLKEYDACHSTSTECVVGT